MTATVARGPTVSVVIPAYNAERHLAECLDSVLGQRGPFTLEVIVVDDGSRDASAAIAEGTPGVRCLRQANAGPSAARNAGIRAATGDHVAFLDADDLWPSGKLAPQVAALEDDPALGLVFGDCRQFSGEQWFARTEFQSSGLGPAAWGRGPRLPDAYARLVRSGFITTGSVVARRSALLEAGGFAEDLRLAEDLDLWLRIARRHPIGWCAHECLHRRRHDSNISGDGEAMALAYLEVLRRHAGTWQLGDPMTAGLDAGRLSGLEYLHLAELAGRRGQTWLGLSRVCNGLRRDAGADMLWRSAKATLKLLIGAARPPRAGAR